MIWSSIKTVDAVIVQTQWMKEAIVSKMYNCSDKVFVIPPAIDLTIFKDKNLVQDETMAGKNTFFYPAGALLYKNFDCLIKAANRLLEKGIDDFRIILTLKGDENSYVARIKKMAESLGERVVFAGKMSREEVFRTYFSSTLVFPSYIETFGLPLLEARLSGSIVLALDCPFSREILKGYQNTYYFDPFDADLLADLMSKVIFGSIIASDNIVSGEIQNACGWENVLSIIEGCRKDDRRY
jgi:glycosyltransferase involved in cell wall biosynthesis